MITLALEQSTEQGSLALFRDRNCLATREWVHDRKHSPDLFRLIPATLADASVSLREIDTYAVGRGPGMFSGLRVAMTTANALALPEKRRVFAVSSGEALARRFLADSNNAHVAVVGDARRGTLWLGVFGKEGTSGSTDVWQLATPHELGDRMPADTLILSPDWDRLREHLSPLASSGARLLEEKCRPSARDVAALALDRIEGGAGSEPLTPIYMHPPVAKKPET